MTGNWYSKDYGFLETTVVRARLVDPTTGTVLASTTNARFRNKRGLEFHFSLKRRNDAPPAFYPVVEMLDGDSTITSGVAVEQLVDVSQATGDAG